MKINLMQRKFKSLSMAFKISRLYDDCAEQSSTVIDNAIKIFTYPHVQEVGHWTDTLVGCFSRFRYSIRGGVKPKIDRIRKELYAVDLHSCYLAVIERHVETPLDWHVVEKQLNAYLSSASELIYNNACASKPVVLRTIHVESLLRGITPKL